MFNVFSSEHVVVSQSYFQPTDSVLVIAAVFFKIGPVT